MQHVYVSSLFFLLLQSCAPILPIVRVDPSEQAEISAYRYGNPVQTLEVADVGVEASFYDASGEYLVFDVQVINHSDQDLLFEPAHAALVTGEEEYAPAIDPEFQLLALDQQLLKMQRRQRTAGLLTVAAVVGSVTYAAVDGSGGGGGQTETYTDSYFAAAAVVDPIVDVSVFALLSDPTYGAARSGYLVQGGEVPDPSNRFFWLDHSFRKTTIRAGERAFGKLAFLRRDASTDLRLVVRVASQTFPFTFEQRILRR